MDNKDNFKYYIEMFGEAPMHELIEKYELKKTPNVLVSHQKIILSNIQDMDSLNRFVEYLNTSDLLFNSINAPNFKILWKRYNMDTTDRNKREGLDEYQGKEIDEVSNHSNGIDEKLNEKIVSIFEGVKALTEDDSDIRIYNKVSDVEGLMTKQINSKTEKKATYEQVQSLEKTSEEMVEGLNKLEKILPSNIEKFYTSKDLTKFFVLGIGVTILLMIVLGLIERL